MQIEKETKKAMPTLGSLFRYYNNSHFYRYVTVTAVKKVLNISLF
jgi:hypothetical protein